MRKRVLSIVLVLALCLAYLPAQAFAEDLAYPITTDAELQTAILTIQAITADSYTLNINADGLTYATAANFGDKTVIFNLNGNTLTLDTITFNGSLTINGAGTLDADFQAGDNAELIFQNGVTLNNNNIQIEI